MFKRDNVDDGLIDKVVHISRVAKVVKGGRRFSFSAIVVVGDGKGQIGYGLGKAGEVPEAIRKGVEKAKKNMSTVALVDGTIPFQVTGKYGAGKVLLKAGFGRYRRDRGRRGACCSGSGRRTEYSYEMPGLTQSPQYCQSDHQGASAASKP